MQLHHQREEIWTIIDGKGELVLGEEKKIVSAGDTIRIDREQKHKISAIEDLQIIETQIGDSLDEEDIERFDY